ncbi:MAG: folylpolyglutamate synthase/dihydrofolate synthase family protein [Candidatus Hydrogenedentota bacterium]
MTDPIEQLFSLEYHGIKLGLDNINALLDAADHPETAYPTVHVAGTNGKGSTVAFLDHILRKAGYRVGRFTSPHLCELNERFMLNGKPIGDDSLRAILKTCLFHAEQLDITPTFFEMNTAVAFQIFKEANVDIALVEVGLGGRFDSTNVITPLLSIITNIALEHTEYLGETIPEIAFEKAGILKPKVPVILGSLLPQAQAVAIERARELDCIVHIPGADYEATYDPANQCLDYQDDSYSLKQLDLGLLGTHQAGNAAVAIRAASLLGNQFPEIRDKAIRAGISATTWPCRMEQVLDEPLVMIDVAHNPDGIRTLVRELNQEVVVVLSVSTDKDARTMISTLKPITAHLILTQFDGKRATPASELLPHVPHDWPHEIIESFNAAIDEGIQRAESLDLPLLITGSLFTAGQARAILIEQYDADPMRF